MEYSYAGLWVRIKAFALDYVIILIYLMLVAAGAMVFNLTAPGVIQIFYATPLSSQITSFMIVTLPVILYFALLESSVWQATWGKRRVGLRVIRTDGKRLSTSHALGRTLLKFATWELSHTLIWQVGFTAQELPPLVAVGFGLVWLLIGVNILSLLMSKTRQTLYDRLVSTHVIAS